MRGPLVRATGEKLFDLDETMATVPAYLEAGATDITVAIQGFVQDPADAPEFFERVVAGFRAAT